MLSQIVLPRERPLAVPARKRSLPGVSPHVTNHVTAVRGQVPALSADESSRSGGRERVALQDVDRAAFPIYQSLRGHQVKRTRFCFNLASFWSGKLLQTKTI